MLPENIKQINTITRTNIGNVVEDWRWGKNVYCHRSVGRMFSGLQASGVSGKFPTQPRYTSSEPNWGSESDIDLVTGPAIKYPPRILGSQSLRINVERWWKPLWKLQCPEKSRMFMWCILRNKVPTWHYLQKNEKEGRRRWCSLCKKDVETVSTFISHMPLHTKYTGLSVGSCWHLNWNGRGQI